MMAAEELPPWEARLPADLQTALDGFEPASPVQLEALALQRRFDRKFVLGMNHLPTLLGDLHPGYVVVLAAAARLAFYDTLYFDTDDLRCYHDHRRKRRPRVKLRIRHYHDRALTVLEAKLKTARGETDKRRLVVPYGTETLSAEALAWLQESCPQGLAAEALKPQARTVFYRLSLLGVHTPERCTLDLSLCFQRRDLQLALHEPVVIEVKAKGHGQHSPLLRSLRRLHAVPRSVSKYCAAIAALEQRARPNLFLPALRSLGVQVP